MAKKKPKTKICIQCKKEKELTEFYEVVTKTKNANTDKVYTYNSHLSYCKICHKEKVKINRKKRKKHYDSYSANYKKHKKGK